MAANMESLQRSNAARVDEPNSNLQRLVDDGSVYVPQALNAPQFATLQALLNRIVSGDDYAYLAIHLDTGLAKGRAASSRKDRGLTRPIRPAGPDLKIAPRCFHIACIVP